MKLRYSPSTIKVLKNCPFRLYCKITKQKQDPDTDVSYGKAGNVVHHTLEYYYEHLTDIELQFALVELENRFNILWEEAELTNPVLKKDLYWLAVVNGVKLKIKPTHLEYEFKVSHKDYDFIGYADIMNTAEHWIGDWKTATYKKAKLRDYEEQLKYYAWCYQKEFGVIPTAWVYFNKENKIFKYKFSQKIMDDVEQEVTSINDNIQEKLKTMEFERNPSKGGCYFCPYKQVCSTDLLRKSNTPLFEVIFHLQKNKLGIQATIPEEQHKILEDKINFQVKNAHFIIKAMAAKGIKYDGIKRLYRRKEYGAETFIGYSHLVYDVLKDFAHSKGKKIQLTLKDYRDQDVLNAKIKVPDKLNIDFELYDFQPEAVKTLLKYRWGIIEVGTGGGKTIIAAEAIRQLGLRTLFIIDNKDLLFQTKKEYEELLGLECGVVGTGKREWNYPIVLATIQTLAKYAKTFSDKLAAFPAVIYDETHIIASKSFETVSKYLINTKYRFGFSATARRDDGNDNIIYAHTGTVVYKRKAQTLIDDGVLIKPEAIFYDYKSTPVITDNWQNEYADGIVDNEDRNEMIATIAEKYISEGKQVMILTKMIRHAEFFNSRICGSGLIYGRTEDDIRVDILDKFKTKEIKCLVGNIKIFNKGINIKNLDVIINAAGNAGDVVTVQTIGRALRKCEGKQTAYYIDFVDSGEYLKKHSFSRIAALENEGYNITRNNYT